jgi:pimeloyl-ACP methyl ester carboxylesterase
MDKSFRYHDATISYNVYGSGMPVMLLHGFAEDHSIWNKQVDGLSRLYQLIIPDLPGSGKSDLLEGENFRMEAYAACVNALLVHEKIEGLVMLGHSMGGYITLAFAERYPAKLKGFGFVHSTAFEDSEEKKAMRRKGIKMMEEYGAFSFIKNTTPNLFSEKFKKEQPAQVNAVIEAAKDFTVAALTQYYNAMLNRRDRKNVLVESTRPVLFIAGTDDAAAPLRDVLEQVHLPRVSYIHVINNVGHMGMIEAPGEVNKHLLQFLDLCEHE